MIMTRRRIVQGSVPATLALASVAGARAIRPLRLLILGGTGFIGPNQVSYALARGHKVTLFNRGRAPHAWPGQVEELLGDRNTGDLSSLAGREWDVVIDNPTTLPFWVRDAGKVLAGHVGHYIFVSTISVYAASDKPADETAAVAAYAGKDAMAETTATLTKDMGGLYGPLKALSEAEAERRFPGKTTIVRPGLISGPGDATDRFTYWPVRLARGGDVAAPGTPSDPVQLIDARDLAEWTVRLAETGTTGVFNATGPARRLDMGHFLQRVGAGVGAKDLRYTWVPASFLEAQKVQAWSDMPVWVPPEGDTAGFHRRSIARAMKAGLTYRPLQVTARDTLAWFHTLPAERQAKLKSGLTPEREAELLAAWRAAPGPK
jgi:2'-hydroxyisoflavone reductase